MATDRTAKVTWAGSLMDGSGRIESVGSGAFGPLDVTWASRAEDARRPHEPRGADRRRVGSRASRWRSPTGSRSAGTPPERLETSATVTFEPGTGITKGAIAVVGTVPGVDHGSVRRGTPRARRRTARSRRRSPASPRSRSTRRSRSVCRGCARRGAARDRPRRAVTYNRRHGDAGTSGRRARALVRRAAGAHVRSCRLQRPPRGGGRSAGASRSSSPPCGSHDEWRQATRRPRGGAAAIPSSRRMAGELEVDVQRLEDELKLALVERDPADEKDVIVEVRQGVGGDEAALWAGEVARMLTALRRAPRLQDRGRSRRARTRAAASRRPCSP